MNEINALSASVIRHSEFVRLSIGGPSPAVYTFCNAAAPITVGGITFSNLGMLLSLGDVQREIKSTSDEMTIALTGVDPASIALILATDIKGATVEVWRGFFDADNQIISSPSLQFFKRYQGLVANMSISEDWDTNNRFRVATCSISCSSMRAVLENRVSGIKTNQSSWQFAYPGDTSMNRAAEIANTFFDFGAPVT
ncbi:MAG: hypothetical protein WBI20_14830 [Burkholderiaceae bacterium]